MNMKKIIVSVLFTLSGVTLVGCDKPSPEELKKKQHLPDIDFIADVDTGYGLFHTNCSRCHGKEGTGSDHGPPLVHKVYRPGHHADLTFHWAVKDGAKQHHWQFGDMPPIANLSPNSVGHIIAYIRSEQRKAGIE